MKAKGPPWAPLNTHSAWYTCTYKHTEKITYTNTSCKANKDSRQRQAHSLALFFHPPISTHKHMHMNTYGNALMHTYTHHFRRLIEVSAPAIVFVHLGMKEPFWPVWRRQQCGTAPTGAQLGYVCLRISGRGAAKCGCTSLPHSSTHQLPLNKYTQPTGSNNDIQPEREERTAFRKHLHAKKSAVG